MIAIFELREVLEGLAARRAAEQITDREIAHLKGFFRQFEGAETINDLGLYAREDRRFHKFVSEAGSKEFLKSILETFNIISFSYQSALSEGLVRPPEETIREHMAIIEAISKRDAAAAEHLMRRHLSNSIAVLKKTVEP
jgi:DNA-binding GntR family transcriptional regulator